MQNYEILISSIVKEAASNKKKFNPKEMAKALGITLTPDTVADLIKKYYNANLDGNLIEAKLGPRGRQLAALAALLMAGFVEGIAAQNEPITVQTPFGQKTYSAKEMKSLAKTDKKTFDIIMDQFADQKDAFSKGVYNRAMGYSTDKAPAGYEKATKGIEELSDEFGNSGRLITFTDGSKQLEGDILHGGVSYRQKLERSGDIAKGGGPYAVQK